MEHILDGLRIGKLLETALASFTIQVHCPFCNHASDWVDGESEQILCPACGKIWMIEAAEGVDLSENPVCRMGKFELTARLGAGSFATVWQARDLDLGRKVAIKIPRPDRFQSRTEEERFLREARLTSRLEHPNIVPVYEIGHTGSFPYLVTEFVEGGSMAAWLQHHRPTFQQTATWARSIALAVDYCHGKGVVHRDLKPANIMLGPQKIGPNDSPLSDSQSPQDTPSIHDASRLIPRLMDFGMAKMKIEEPTLTLNGQMLGTPIYMSPEQIRHGEAVDGRTDIYAIGIILYQSLTGELPFRGTQEMLIQQTLQDDPQAPRKLNQSIPKDLEIITLKCLQKEPSRRYQTGHELARDLQLWLENKPIQSRPITRRELVGRWCRRYPGTSSLLALLMVVTLGAIVLITWQWKKAEDQRRLAVKNLAEARRAIDSLLAEVGNNVLLNRPGMQPLQMELLEQALTQYQRLLENDPNNPELIRDLAMNWTRVASLAYQTGNPGNALRDYTKAIDLYDKLVHFKGASSVAIYERAIIYLNKAAMLSKMRRDEEAITFDEKGLEDLKIVGNEVNGSNEQKRALTTIYGDMAASYSQLGDYDKAYQLNQEALKLDLDLEKTNPNDCNLQIALGGDLIDAGLISDARGKKEEALRDLLAGMSYLQQALKIKPYSLEYQAAVAKGNLQLANCLSKMDRIQESFDPAQSSLANLEVMVRENPAIDEYKYLLAWAYQEVGAIHDKNKEPGPAVDSYHHAISILERLNENDAQDGYKWKLSEAYFSLAQIYGGQKNIPESLDLLYKCNHLRTELLDHNPNAKLARQRLIDSLEETEKILRATGAREKADEIRTHLNGLKELKPDLSPTTFMAPSQNR